MKCVILNVGCLMWSIDGHSCDVRDKRYRLVCHNCGTKGPVLIEHVSAGPSKICNCASPRIHIHCVEHPCPRCEEP